MTTRASVFLDPDEIRTLDGLFLDATRAVETIRARAAVGQRIHRVKLPAALTEGLAASAVGRLFGETAFASRPVSGKSDLSVRSSTFDDELLVAVKGTGAARWVTITETDLEASCLLWVDYTDRIIDPSQPAMLWSFMRPLRGWCRTGRTTLRQLVGLYGSSPDPIAIEPCD